MRFFLVLISFLAYVYASVKYPDWNPFGWTGHFIVFIFYIWAMLKVIDWAMQSNDMVSDVSRSSGSGIDGRGGFSDFGGSDCGGGGRHSACGECVPPA